MGFTEPLNIRTLGVLSISQGDQPVSTLVSRKVEALLIYLAYEQREHPREWLATLLWDEMLSERAMGNLRTALSNLQTQIPGCLVVTRQTAMFNPDMPLWFDALELTRVLDDARGTRLPVAQLEKALDLYQGEFLSGFHVRDGQNFEQWMIAEADRLRAKVLVALPKLAEAAIDQGRFAAAVDYARRMLSLDPLSEEGQRGLIAALAYSGQRGLALKQYNSYVRLLRDELNAAPEAATTQLYTQIQNQQLTIPPPRAEGSTQPQTLTKPAIVRLPRPATPFIERHIELNQIAERLANPDCRLLTIVGPGGSGKTRLAIQSAADCTGQFSDGIYFISLAATQSAAFIPLDIAQAIQFSFQSADEPRKVLLDYLATREQLLVLDNFEHLLEGAGLIADILLAAPHVKLLVTSREWLNLQGEWVLPIGGMDVPNAVSSDTLGYSAVQLFEACAARIQPRFLLEDNLEAVVQICQLVEGMPLSIELAATWLRVMSATEIAQQISVRFLSTGARDAPERHRSIEAVFDYSWRLLSPEEAQFMMKLSVFRGPFSRAAAAQVAGAEVSNLAVLLEKSLIRRFDANHYDLHELLRQFAFDYLSGANEVTATRDAHLAYYVMFTADPDSRVHGQRQTEWLDQLEQAHDNLRAALTWALASGTEKALEAGLSLGASLWEFWLMRGHIREGRDWLVRLLDATPGVISKARGNVTQGAGYLTWIQGDSDSAEALHREGLAMRRVLDDKAGMGGSLSNLGVIAWGRGDFKAARDFYEQALAVRREANYRLGMASVLTNLALLLQDQGEYKDALDYAAQALALFTELDDLQGKSLILLNMGAITYNRGDWAQARTLQEEALVVTRTLGDRRMTGALLQNLSQTMLSLGDGALAGKYLDESLELITESGIRRSLD